MKHTAEFVKNWLDRHNLGVSDARSHIRRYDYTAQVSSYKAVIEYLRGFSTSEMAYIMSIC